MDKLLKLKKWLTLDEAATRLTSTVDQEITEADILRLGLDGMIRLSVYLPGNVPAKRCKRTGGVVSVG